MADRAPSRIAVGLIGGGSASRAYLRALDSLVASGHAAAGPICVRRRDAWNEFLRTRPDARLVADAGDVLEANVDLVVITTPPDSHADLTCRALEQGKHVVVEKPLTTDWGCWRSYASPDRTWNWTDGLREAVMALATGSSHATDVEHDIHVVEVLDAANKSAADDGRPVTVASTFGPLKLAYDFDPAVALIHDPTRPAHEQ